MPFKMERSMTLQPQKVEGANRLSNLLPPPRLSNLLPPPPESRNEEVLDLEKEKSCALSFQ